MTTPPSGVQYQIGFGEQRATIVEVGGGIRAYAVGERNVLNPYPENTICDGAHGAPLIPWPNRLADGRYSFDGVDYQAPLTEPAKDNAIHGFLRWRSWHPTEQSENRVVMSTTLRPMTWYPFALDVRVEYVLEASGLTVTTIATNIGSGALPYGSGQHPYLSPGVGTIDECTLELNAATRVDTDPVRQLPTGRVPVADSTFDFRRPRRLGGLAIDFAFTDLVRDENGLAWVHLTGSDGRAASLWVDDAYPYLELYTGDTLAPERQRTGLGCEPMTCPPNALATGEQVVRLTPGESVTSAWGAELR